MAVRWLLTPNLFTCCKVNKNTGMNLRASVFLSLLVLSGSSTIYAQERLIEKQVYALWFGVRDISRERFNDNENLDFLNYLHSSPKMAEYQYIGLSSHLWFRGSWEADLRVGMYDDFAPNTIYMKAIWLPWRNLGFTAGFLSYPQLINDFSSYHRLNDEGYYGDTDRNFRQRRVHESGLVAGVVIPLNYRFLHLTFNLNGGISTLSTFREEVTQKEINTNFRREIHYETLPSPALFFFPEAEFRIDCFNIGKSKMGIQVKSSWYRVVRSVDYKRDTYDWTYDSLLEEKVDNPVHVLTKFEFDFGINLTWQ